MPSQACQKSEVGDAVQHASLLAALNLPEGVPSELEVVALLVDGPASRAINQDAIVDSADEVVEGRRLGRWLQPNVRNALKGNGGIAVGVAASMRLFVADQVRLVANRLIADEDSAVDDVKTHGFHPVVVVAAGGKTA